MTISTGIASLDARLDGGYQEGTLCAMSGEEGIGKTALLHAAMVSALRAGERVAYFDVKAKGIPRMQKSGFFQHKDVLWKDNFTPHSELGKLVSMAIKQNVRLIVIDGPVDHTFFNPNKLYKEVQSSSSTVLLASTSNNEGPHLWLSLLLTMHMLVRWDRDAHGEVTDHRVITLEKAPRGKEISNIFRFYLREGQLLKNDEPITLAPPPTSRSRYERDVLLAHTQTQST